MSETASAVLRILGAADLLGDAGRVARADAGVRRVDLVAPAGSYRRRRPRVLDLDPTASGAKRYLQNLNKLVEQYPATHRFVISNAVVTGAGSVITRNSILLHDSCWEYLARDLTPPGLQPGADNTLSVRNTPSRWIERPSLLLKRPWWQNYGHWLVDAAAQLALQPGIAMPPDWQIVTGAFDNPAMRRVVHDTISILAPGIPIVEHADDDTWQFAELHFIQPLSRPGLFKLPQGLAVLRAQLLPRDAPRSDTKRLYISRGADPKRRVINDDVITRICEARGFTIVHPETSSLREQARLFHGADIVVGVKGAALSNLIYATSSCRVVVLSPMGWGDTFFWDLAGQMGMKYTDIFGVPDGKGSGPAEQSFTVNPETVARTLDELIAKRA